MDNLSTILLLIGLGIILYLIIAGIMQYQAESERNQKIEFAEKKYKIAINDTKNSKKQMLKIITDISGEYDAKRVDEGTIWIGMDFELLLASWGKAFDIKENYSNGYKIEKWYFAPYYNRLNNLKFKLEVTLENNKVTGWKDLV